MSEKTHSNGWRVGFFIVIALLVITMATNATKSNKIDQLNTELSAAQAKTNQTAATSPAPSSTPTISTPIAQPTTTKQSWLCSNTLDTGLGNINVDLLCPSSTGSTTELSCTGNISTDLTSQSYTYAPLDMTCTTQ